MQRNRAAESGLSNAYVPPVLAGAALLVLLSFAATAAFASTNWISPPGLTPITRSDAAMTYEVAREQVVLCGGVVGGGGLAGLNNETWLLESGNWRQAGPQHFPLGRQNAGVAYDSARQRVVLLGGYTAGSIQFADSNDTWIWDGADWSQVWTSPLPESMPGAREAPAMAHFSDLGQIILFGGLSSNSVQTSTLRVRKRTGNGQARRSRK